ncbi:hypothetical protein HKK80_10785 [Halonotius sp. F2-221B]|jgi:hypothetical protein
MRSSSTGTTTLTDKQQRILSYFHRKVDTQMYFKSRIIGQDIGLSANEVGTNIGAIRDGEFGLAVERWGKSGGITWKVTEEPVSVAD